MDPYSLHQMQQAGALDPRPEDAPADLLELLLDKFVETAYGRQVAATPHLREALINFLACGKAYLQGNPVVGQGMLAGGLTMVFEDGENVPLVAPREEGPARTSEVYAVTTPREGRAAKGMSGGESEAIGVTGHRRR